MNEQNIKDLIDSVVSKRKAKWNFSQWLSLKKDDKDYKKPDYPEYYPSYGLAIEMMEACRYHAEKGCFPARLFAHKSPYQTDAELTYIKNNYKQVTLPIPLDLINTVSRCFNDGNFSIKYLEDDPMFKDNTLQDYLEKGINTFGSLLNFFKFLFVSIKMTDANGVIAIKPDFVVEQIDGEKVISKTALNSPQVYYYDCSKIVSFKEEDHCLVDVTDYSKSKITELRYELYTADDIFFITYDNKERKITELVKYYNHKWGQIPVTKIKGLPRLVDGEIMWQSVLSFATDILDIVAIDNTSLNMAKFKCAYPIRVYEGRPCDYEYTDKEGNTSRCIEGHCFDSSIGKNIVCPDCHGIGMRDRFSLMHDFIVDTDSTFENKSGSRTPFQYVAPSAEILEYLENAIAKNEERARKILHLQTSNSEVKGTENLTATGMALGDKSTSAFIKPISDQIYDVLEFCVEAIAFMRYGENAAMPIITRPNTFDFQTEYDYMNEIATAIKSGLPPVMIHSIIERYLHSHFHSDETVSRAFNLILATDRLMGMQTQDIAIEVSKNLVAPFEVVLHDSALNLIKNLVAENEGFFEQDLKAQKEQLITKAKEIADANKPAETSTKQAISDVLAA